MANRKNLKKDIHFICFELISECLIYQSFNPEVSQEKIDTIISDIIKHENDYISRINKPDGKDNRSLVKKHFNKIVEDLNSKTIPLLDKLQEK